MRKIVNREDEEKKKKRNRLIVGLVLVGVMMFSTLGFALNNDNTTTPVNIGKVNYNGHEFTLLTNNLWYLKIGDAEFGFTHNPQDVPKITSTLKPLGSYYNLPLYVSSESLEAERDISLNLDNVVLRRQSACLSEEDCQSGYPIKTCSDNFIIIEESEVQEITQNESCVFIRGPKEDLVKLTDEFLFKIIGVE